MLARHSDDVLGTFLAMSGREYLLAGVMLVAAEKAILELLAAVRSPGQDASSRARDGPALGPQPLAHAFAAPEDSYKPLTAAEVIPRNRT